MGLFGKEKEERIEREEVIVTLCGETQTFVQDQERKREREKERRREREKERKREREKERKREREGGSRMRYGTMKIVLALWALLLDIQNNQRLAKWTGNVGLVHAAEAPCSQSPLLPCSLENIINDGGHAMSCWMQALSLAYRM